MGRKSHKSTDILTYQPHKLKVDGRLEHEQQLKQAIRKKILLKDRKAEPSSSLEHTLIDLDVDDTGRISKKEFIREMKKFSLSSEEVDYLQLRLRPSAKTSSVIEYDRLFNLLHLYDEDFDDQYTSEESDSSDIYDNKSHGNAFSIEHALSRFVQRNGHRVIQECSQLSSDNKLMLKDLQKALKKSGCELLPIQIRAVLSEFPRDSRGYICYTDFISQYTSCVSAEYNSIVNEKEEALRRYVKTTVTGLLSPIDPDPLRKLRKKFERADQQLHSSLTGSLPQNALECVLDSVIGISNWTRKDTMEFLGIGEDSMQRDRVDYMSFISKMISKTHAYADDNKASLLQIISLIEDFLSRNYQQAQISFENLDKSQNKRLTGSLSSEDFKKSLCYFLKSHNGPCMGPRDCQQFLKQLRNEKICNYKKVDYINFLRAYSDIDQSSRKIKLGITRNKNIAKKKKRAVNNDASTSLEDWLNSESETSTERVMLNEFVATLERFENANSLGLNDERENDRDSKNHHLTIRLGPNLRAGIEFYTV